MSYVCAACFVIYVCVLCAIYVACDVHCASCVAYVVSDVRVVWVICAARDVCVA